jgi:hypothetical protein
LAVWEIMKRRQIRTQIICTIICSALLAVTMPAVSYAEDVEDAEDSEDASYLCTREIAAGLAYNKARKKWEGVRLPSDGSFSRFILRMKFLKERTQRNVLGENETVNDYEITITETETNNAFPCRSAGTGIHTKIVVVGDDDNVACSARTYDFTFNVETNRFISVYLHGYADGIDSNENTPMVSGGTCAKIDQTK